MGIPGFDPKWLVDIDEVWILLDLKIYESGSIPSIRGWIIGNRYMSVPSYTQT